MCPRPACLTIGLLGREVPWYPEVCGRAVRNRQDYLGAYCAPSRQDTSPGLGGKPLYPPGPKSHARSHCIPWRVLDSLTQSPWGRPTVEAADGADAWLTRRPEQRNSPHPPGRNARSRPSRAAGPGPDSEPVPMQSSTRMPGSSHAHLEHHDRRGRWTCASRANPCAHRPHTSAPLISRVRVQKRGHLL